VTCTQTPAAVQKRCSSDIATLQYEWFTPFLPVIGVDDIDADMKVRAMLNTLHWQLAAQYCTIRTDKPSDPVLLDSLQTTGAGERCVNGVQLAGANEMFFRIGMAYKSSTGGTLAAADIWQQIAYNACGSIIATGSQRLEATSTDTRFIEITDFIPRKSAAKVKIVFVASGFNGANFRFQAAQQKVATSREVPGAWALLQGANYYTAAGEYNTGEIALSYSGDWESRFGIGYNLSSGSFGQADLAWAVAVRT
jgi:hypothetical protein